MLLGSAPVKGVRKYKTGQREKLGHHAVSTVASANLTGNSEAVMDIFLW